jgi:hypothetical protein
MKTKTFFCLCLLSGMVVSDLYAQSVDNRSYSEVRQVYGWFPVYCNGVHQDLYTTLDVHYMVHYNNGVYEFQISQWRGEGTSSTGEVFKWSEVDKADGGYHFHGNLNGDAGSHFIISGTINYSVRPVIVTIDKAVCLEKVKK